MTETEDTRRRAIRSELLSAANDPDVMDEIIDTYAAYRLLSLDNDPETRSPTVEVAHEAILHEWDRLSGWLDDSREAIHMQRQLTRMAADWRAAKYDASFLLHGARLDQFAGWASAATVSLTTREQDFINASQDERARRQTLEQERQAREESIERRSQIALRALIAVFALATIVATV